MLRINKFAREKVVTLGMLHWGEEYNILGEGFVFDPGFYLWKVQGLIFLF